MLLLPSQARKHKKISLYTVIVYAQFFDHLNVNKVGIYCEILDCPHETCNIMTSSNGNGFRVTGHLCGEFTGPRWIPRTKASDGGALMFSLICARINGWVNNHKADDLRRHPTHCDVIVMNTAAKLGIYLLPSNILASCESMLSDLLWQLWCIWSHVNRAYLVALGTAECSPTDRLLSSFK